MIKSLLALGSLACLASTSALAGGGGGPNSCDQLETMLNTLGIQCTQTASTRDTETYACTGAQRLQIITDGFADDDVCEPRIVGATAASVTSLLESAGYTCPIPTAKDACGKEEPGNGGYGSIAFIKKSKGTPAGIELNFVYGPVRK